jgi:hypothetical protein
MSFRQTIYFSLPEKPLGSAENYGTAVADGTGVAVNLDVAVGSIVLVGVRVIVGVAEGNAVGVITSEPK